LGEPSRVSGRVEAPSNRVPQPSGLRRSARQNLIFVALRNQDLHPKEYRMKRMIRFSSCLGFILLLSLALVAGCTPPKTGGKDGAPVTKGGAKEKDAKPHDHSDVGPHGGTLVEWDDTYHAEFTLDHANKTATIYILDDKAKLAPKIDAGKITKVLLTITSVKPFIEVNLTHDAKLSSEKGIVFTGTNDYFAKTTEFKGQLDGTVDGKTFGGPLNYKPSKAALFLAPGGIYTVADIKANGNMTPAEKFKGKNLTMHDAKAKAGDPLCPITGNKAEAECAWTVKGQQYHFCCPPCLNQFIDRAHHQPEKIKDAKEYVHRGT
jgi:YHS domain-containing protein